MTSLHVEKVTNNIESIGLEGISISAGIKELIKKSNVSLMTGRRYGICGRNGCGKTTLLKYINSLIPFSIYIDQYISQEKWNDINIVEAILQSNTDRYELLKKLEASHDDLELYQKLCEELEGLEVDKDESIVRKLLHGLGFTDQQMEQTYYEFSGGWKTRISLARALYMRPKVLFLDEPTNHLDLEAVTWLENYLQDYNGILICVSHSISFLNTVCTDILHIFMSNIRHYSGNYHKFQKQLSNDLIKLEKDYEKYQKEIKALRSKGKIKEANELLKKDIPRPEKPYKITMKFEADTSARDPYITLSNVTFGYSDKKLIKNVDLSLCSNMKMTIVGKNGCGKSTLLKLIMGIIEPEEGRVIKNERVKISYFNQHSIEELPEEETPVEYLTNKYGLEMESVRKILGSISLENQYHNKKMKILSGGQRMRIVFSEVILEKPHLILLDEPTNHLDIETIECLIDSINKYNGTVLIITHDLFLIEETDCQVYHLHDGLLEHMSDGIDSYIESLEC